MSDAFMGQLTGPASGVGTPYRGVRALVTGASGFIGRWVARLLSRAGSDLLLASRDPRALREVVDQLEINGEPLPVDLGDEASVNVLIRRVRPAVTFHLAGYGVNPAQTDEREARRINALAVRFIADAIARRGSSDWPGQQLVHAGTAQEYGAAGGNLDEGGPAVPTTVYGRTKLEGTNLLIEPGEHPGLRALTARLFTVYGPGERDGRLLPSLRRAAEMGELMALTAGTQRRDFTYVGDVAEGFLRLGVCEAPGRSIVNLATGRLTSVREFAEIAAPIVGLPPERLRFNALPARSDEMEHEPVSLARLRQLTGGWQPSTSIAEGVSSTLAHQSRG